LAVRVKFGPGQIHPGQVILIIETVQMLHQECIILLFNVYNTKPSLIFGFTGRLPCY
jgi:hypothetical protein